MRILSASIISALLVPVSLFAVESSTIKSPIHGTADADATGFAVATIRATKSQFLVRLAKLTPSHIFDIEVAGIVEGTVTTDKKGKASATFATPVSGRALPLDFDPRGETVRILDGGVSVAEGVVSGAGEGSGAQVDERTELESEHAPENSSTSARFTLTSKGKKSFRLDMKNLPAGDVKILVNGIEQATVTVSSRVTTVLFDTNPTRPGVLLLDFDPRSAVVEVLSGTTVLFSGQMEAKARGVNRATPSMNRIAIPSTGVDVDGTAEACLKTDNRARKHLSVEVEDVPVGPYDLLVDGVKVGTIQVSTVTGGTKGEIEFTTGDDDPTELALTFDPAGKALSIKSANVTYFEGTFDPNVTGAGTPAPEAPSQVLENLTSSGLDSDASAKARYEVDNKGRHKFSVEVEKVPVGSYTLSVAGVVRGAISAKLVQGVVKGEIEFQTEREPGHAPLNFDPRGQTIEISSADGLFFSHLFGNGSATPGTPGAVPFDTVAQLTSTGADSNATGKAEYKLSDTGSLSFEVEVEDLTAGSYDLLVGGTVRGSIAVAATSKGTKGKIKFEDASLTFDVAGQAIEIRQGVTTFFTRTFPAL